MCLNKEIVTMSEHILNPKTNMTGNSGELSPWYYTVLLYINIIMCPLVLLGNLLVLCVIIKYKKMRTVTNYVIGNLATVDLLTSGVALPFYSAVYFTDLHLHQKKYFCLGAVTLIVTSIFMTGSSVALIALERYLFINWPYFYATVKAKRLIKGLLVAAWVLSGSVLFVAPLVGWNKWKSGDKCTIQVILPSAYYMLATGIQCIFLVTTTYLYIRIALVASKHKIAIESQNLNSGTSKRNSKVTKMLSIILGLYYICVVPYVLLTVIKLSYGKSQPPWLDIVTKILVSFTLVNSLLNPFIYGTQNMIFREAFLKLLCRKSRAVEAEDFVMSSRGNLIWINKVFDMQDLHT